MNRVLQWMAAGMVVVVTGCATTSGGGDAARVKDMPMEAVLQSVDGVTTAVDKEKALALLEAAAKANPADARPWLKSAQMQFDAANYPSAILAAEEAYKRDPSNAEAKSLALVSSLRVAVKYVSDLRANEKLQGGARSDAEQLAQSLRETLGAQVLVPSPAASASNADVLPKIKKLSARASRATTVYKAPATAIKDEMKGAVSDPFGMLK
jgi:tetratricopeptide (TPR) repeat protein